MARDRWLHHLDYLITLVGYSVGGGTIQKFPYLCMRNGGGAFLIVFMLFTVIGAIPCVFVEMVIGQFSQSGPVTVWNMCPPFKGIGLGTVAITWTLSTYNLAIFSWYLYYFFNSFSTYLPWTLCSNDWNTVTCVTHDTHVNNTISTNITIGGMTAAEEYWRFKVLDITEGLENLAGMRWPLIVYVTVGIPYLLNTIFLIRGCLLPGSAEGIYYYIYPDFEMLRDPNVWMEACAYSFFSMGIGMGCIITLSGHNNLKNNCFRDSIAMCLTDALTTIFVGFSVFSIIGHVAYIRGLDVEAFQSSGFNLAFIVYPQAVSALPWPQLWSALTFLMLMSLMIDSMGGIYVLTLVDWYATFPSLVFFATMECIAVNFCYGTQQLQQDIRTMWGKTAPRWISFCMRIVCPLLLLVIFTFSLYSYRPPQYAEYVYPTWATVVGWMISMASILPFPVFFVWTVYHTSGTTVVEKLEKAIRPNKNKGGRIHTDNENQDVSFPTMLQESLCDNTDLGVEEVENARSVETNIINL
ncbi:sodium- and chloride-dependent GABA transporter 3-like [Haliotis rubra]|uniref:sodium- and chloride-dependent GABA transporter 3-like n=1 Tax=Haliotis rubra TaxID=36100 RepID=UPI001EE545A0|nr:sodium- and chloride-dependent GABA transporter 3-like [Haliotis rubra]